MECVHKPKILLLDEPTSGLDATTALLVVNKLRSIANGENGGHRAAVVTSIHQPRSSIMPLFDSAMLLADGREVYCGPTFTPLPNGGLSENGVIGWLKDVGYPCPPFESPPDFVMDLINTRVEEVDAGRDADKTGASQDAAETGEKPRVHDRAVVVKELTQSWLTSPRRDEYLRVGDEISSMDISSSSAKSGFRRRSSFVVWCTRFGALFSRTAVYKIREPSALATQAVNSVLVPLNGVRFTLTFPSRFPARAIDSARYHSSSSCRRSWRLTNSYCSRKNAVCTCTNQTAVCTAPACITGRE